MSLTLTYSAKLKDPRWQKKRLQVLEIAQWRCEDCGERSKPLEVHHCAYVRGHEPWQYDFNLLMALCGECHEFRQRREDALRVHLGIILRLLPAAQVEEEGWRLLKQISDRETERLAGAFQ